MAVKLLMTWDIRSVPEQDYFEFMVREFFPGMQKLGMEPSDAWATVYGNQPQILVSAQMPTLSELENVLKSSEWDTLTNRLLDFVTNFKYKIVRARNGFQM